MENNIYIYNTPYGHFCLIEKDLISENIRNNGMWEYHLYKFYSEMIKPDYYVIDGGANIGFHTIQFAKLASKGKVFSYEVQNYIYNILSTNILINGLSSKVYQYRIGLGNDKKKNILKIDTLDKQISNDGFINYGGPGLVETSEEDDTIPIIGIDSLNLSKLDFIKLDIQGMELDCLMGAENTIKKYKPILFLEIGVCSASKWNREYGDESMPPSHEKVFDFLKKIGYNSYQIKINGSYSGDTIFLNPLKHTNEIQTFNRLVRDLI